MDEQIEKVEAVTTYATNNPAPTNPATNLPVANPITLPQVQVENIAAAAKTAVSAANKEGSK
jgi:hypothetical protein